jgi:hypothetical protein
LAKGFQPNTISNFIAKCKEVTLKEAIPFHASTVTAAEEPQMLEQHQCPWSTKQQEEFSIPAFSIEEYLHRVDGTNPTELIMVLHGMGGSPRKMERVFAAVRAAKPTADIFLPRLPYADWRGLSACSRPM